MRLYEIVLRPLTAFGTPLVGDTLFGHFCWQVAYQPQLVNRPFEQIIASYLEKPFVVFSSAWPRWLEKGQVWYAFPRPALPRSFWQEPAEASPPLGCREKLLHRPDKALKKKRWLAVAEDLQIDPGRLLDDRELWHKVLSSLAPTSPLYRQLYRSENQRLMVMQGQPHNTISRWHNRTGSDPFRPYTLDVLFYCPGLTLALFVLVDEQVMSLEQVVQGLRQMGQTGFGRDASTGLGRFAVLEGREIPKTQLVPGQALFTLGPVVPAAGSYRRAYYQPVVRFGRHGDRLATSRNPFKTPVVMAAAGAVFVPEAAAGAQPWWGRGLTGLSKTEPKTVGQGYAPYLPIHLEGIHG